MSRNPLIELGLRSYLALTLLFVFAPIAASFVFSFNVDRFPSLPLGGFSTVWYEAVAQDPLVWEGLRNSVVTGIAVSLLSTALGFGAAYTDYRYQFLGKQVYLALALLPPTIPVVILGLAMLAYLSRVGLAGDLVAVIVSHVVMCSPFAMAIIRLRLSQMDPSLEAAAWNLGANEWRAMRSVILPFTLPSVLAALFITMAVSFDEFAALLERFPELLTRVTRADAVWRALRSPAAASPETASGLAPLRRVAHWVEEHGVEALGLLVLALVHVLLFSRAVLHYRAAGANGFVQLARGCGACLNLDCALLIVPMLRRFLSFVRAQPFARALPIDHAVELHKLLGHLVGMFALVHTLAHVANYLIADKPFFEQLLRTKAGLSGVVLLVALAILWACAREAVRRAGRFELFHYTHLLYWPFFAVLLVHGPVWWMWAFAPLGGYLAERILRAETRSKVVEIETEVLPSRVTKLRFAPPKGWQQRAGDYLFVPSRPSLVSSGTPSRSARRPSARAS